MKKIKLMLVLWSIFAAVSMQQRRYYRPYFRLSPLNPYLEYLLRSDMMEASSFEDQDQYIQPAPVNISSSSSSFHLVLTRADLLIVFPGSNGTAIPATDAGRHRRAAGAQPERRRQGGQGEVVPAVVFPCRRHQILDYGHHHVGRDIAVSVTRRFLRERCRCSKLALWKKETRRRCRRAATSRASDRIIQRRRGRCHDGRRHYR